MAKHPIVHVEIPVKDPKAAGEFYASLFDWKLDLDPTLNYLQFEAEGGPGGAFVKIGNENGYEHKANSPLLHIATDDIDATLDKVEALGGKTILPKTEIPGIGWFGIFSDPSGNNISLYTSANPR